MARIPTKKISKTGSGLLPKIKAFMDALGDRYQRALQVIDEALASDNLKDKIWAVDLILKRTPSGSSEEIPSKKQVSVHNPSPEELDSLSDTELLNRIRSHLQDWEP
jgi:hypothetical protein